MNKKQRNRKIVAQNKRNRIINKRYISTTKTLFKLLLIKVKQLKMNVEQNTEQINISLQKKKFKF